MGIVESIGEYASEEDCHAILAAARWPDALSCIRCGSNDARSFLVQRGSTHRRIFQCNDCRYQFSSTTGTIFHHSRISLLKWFVGIYLLSSNPRLSAAELQRTLQITYKAAWRLRKAVNSDLLALDDYFGNEKNDVNELGGRTDVISKEPRRMGRKIVLVAMIKKFGERIPHFLRNELARLAASG